MEPALSGGPEGSLLVVDTLTALLHKQQQPEKKSVTLLQTGVMTGTRQGLVVIHVEHRRTTWIPRAMHQRGRGA